MLDDCLRRGHTERLSALPVSVSSRDARGLIVLRRATRREGLDIRAQVQGDKGQKLLATDMVMDLLVPPGQAIRTALLLKDSSFRAI